MIERVLVGTYTTTRGEGGIYDIAIDAGTGTAEVLRVTAAPDPAYLCLSDDGRHVFSIVERRDLDGWHGGGISSYRRDADGRLELAGTERTFGSIPCFVSATLGGLVLVANCHDGSASIFTTDEQGALSPRQTVISHAYRHARDSRRSHVHCVVPTKDEKGVVVVDTGFDEVVWYGLDPARDGGVTVATLPQGSLPRHVCFSSDFRHAYVVTEATNVVVAYGVPGEEPTAWEELQVRSTLPAGCEWKSSCGAVKCSPDGRWVAVSNRGAETIALFGREEGTGLLEDVSVVELPGHCPRDFAFSPSGKMLVVGLQESDSVVVYGVDQEGRLTPMGAGTTVPSPACVKFV